MLFYTIHHVYYSYRMIITDLLMHIYKQYTQTSISDSALLVLLVKEPTSYRMLAPLIRGFHGIKL